MPSQISQNLKVLLIAQLSVAIVGTLGFGFFSGFQLGASFFVGSVLMLLNMGLIAWSTWRMLTKKSIAWTTMIIVIKYAVLLGSVFYVARSSWFDSLGAGLGIASFLIAVLALAAFHHEKEEDEIGSGSL